MEPRTIFLSSLRGIKVIALLTGLNLLILFIRNRIEHDSALNFLLSNLYSGFIPLVIAYLLLLFYKKTSTFVFWAVALIWMLFYPNSPYMISDLIHESIDDPNRKGLYIFDTLIIFSLAMLSVHYGFMSVKIIYSLVRERYSSRTANVFITCALLLSSLGFYMGRVVKGFVWNSTTSVISHSATGTADQDKVKNLYTSDLFLHPLATLQKAWDSLFPISTHMDAYYMMALITVIQFALLSMMRDIRDYQSNDILHQEPIQPHKATL